MGRTKGDAREGAAILLQGSLAFRASIHIVKKVLWAGDIALEYANLRC